MNNNIKKVSSLIQASVLLFMIPFPVSATNSEIKDSGINYTETVETINNPGAGYTSTVCF